MNTQQTPIQKLLNIPIDNATYTDIHKAVIKGNLQRLKLYLDRGPGPWGTVDSLDWWGRSPLYRAVEKNYIPIVLEILIQGASVDLKEKVWLRTPLHLACEKGYVECVKHLLAYDATVDVSAKEGWTPLMLAAVNGHMEIVQILLNVKANYKLRTKDDYQALHHAAKNNYGDIVHLLLIQNNSDPNVRIYEEGPTALHIAAEHNSSKAVDVLLSHDAEVNARNKKGWAPLHCAVYNGSLEATHSLVSHYSCDLHIKNNEDQEALDICLQRFRSSTRTKKMQQTLAYIRKAYSDEAANQKPDLIVKANYDRGKIDLNKNPNVLKNSPTKDKIDSKLPNERLRNLALNFKQMKTKFRDFIAADVRRRNQQGINDKTAIVSVIEDAMKNTENCINVCKAMNRSSKAAMLTALATKNGDYDIDEEEMEMLRDKKNIDMGKIKKQKWKYGWKEDKLLYLEMLSLHVANLDLKLAGKADGLSAPKWTGRFAKLWQILKTEYNWSSRPGSQRETLKKGEWVMTRLDKPLRHVEGGEMDNNNLEEKILENNNNDNDKKIAYKTQIHYRYGDGTYVVRFGTGEKKHVRRDQLDLIETKKMSEGAFDSKTILQFGTLVMVQLPGWDQPYEGYIVRINTDGTYDVKFMDGSKEQYLERTQMRKKPHPVPYYYFLPGALVSSGKEGVDYFTREEHVVSYIVTNSTWAIEAINNSRRRELRIEDLEQTLEDRDNEIKRLNDLLNQRDDTITIATEVERLLTPTQKRSSNYRAVRKVFTELDIDGDGELTSDEILIGLKHNKNVIQLVKSIPELAPLADPEIYGDAFDTMDVDGNGGVSLQEFMKFRQKLQDIRALFHVIDQNQDGYVSKSEFQSMIANLKRTPKVKRLLHTQPELKEFTNLSTFENAWYELHVKKPSHGVSLGELLLFARKVGLVRRIFDHMPAANDIVGLVYKKDFINRSKDEDINLLLQKDDDLKAMAYDIQEMEAALWEISPNDDTISVDELLRFSRKVASLRMVMETSQTSKKSKLKVGNLLLLDKEKNEETTTQRTIMQIGMERIEFLNSLISNTTGKDSKNINAGVKDVLKRHPELAHLANTTAYHDSFNNTCGNTLGFFTLNDVLMYTRKVSIVENVLQDIVDQYGGIIIDTKNNEDNNNNNTKQKKTKKKKFKSAGIALEDRLMIPYYQFSKAVTTRNKIRRLLSKEHTLMVFLKVRSIQNLLRISCFVVDDIEDDKMKKVLDGNILVNISDEMNHAKKLAKTIHQYQDITIDMDDGNDDDGGGEDRLESVDIDFIKMQLLTTHVTSCFTVDVKEDTDNENGLVEKAIIATLSNEKIDKPLFRSIYHYIYNEKQYHPLISYHYMQMAFLSLQTRNNKYDNNDINILSLGITLEEFIIAGKRIRCLEEIIDDMVSSSNNARSNHNISEFLSYIRETSNHRFIKKYYQYIEMDDHIYKYFKELGDQLKLFQLLIDEVSDNSDTKTLRPYHFLRFANGLHYLEHELFPMFDDEGGGGGGGGGATKEFPRKMIYNALKGNKKVQSHLINKCPIYELCSMVETDDFKKEFLQTTSMMTMYDFFEFGLTYYKSKIAFIKQIKKLFITVAYNENCKVKFQTLMEKGDGYSCSGGGEDSGGGLYNIRTFLRAIEGFRVKGNEPLKKLHDFINENKKKLRRCLNRLFIRKNGGTENQEWNLIGKEEFYLWLKGGVP